ncbi:MAG: DUF4238 domain-containing protein [Bacteroidetes bacterium]|nr:DUF4238 domain-containing protein [Bacteroidota bacterium]
MGIESRRHHFVPQFFLKRFGRVVDGNTQLYAIDLKEGNRFKSGTRGLAVKKDFHRVEFGDIAPDYVENELSKIEGRVASVFREIDQSRLLPHLESENYAFLMTFIALLGVKHPAVRKQYEEFLRREDQALNELIVSTPEVWANVVSRMRRDGYVDPVLPYDEMRQFVMEGENETRFVPGDSLLRELQGVDKIAPILGQRNWHLLEADPTASHLICSDRPVSLLPNQFGVSLQAYGFGTPGTDLISPIGSKMVMVGRMEEGLSDGQLDKQGVAAINSKTVRTCDRFVYSAEETFSCLTTMGIERG